MRKERTQNNIFKVCTEEGSYIPLAKINKEQIKSMLKVALTDLETLEVWQKKAPKESGQWNAIYKLAYDVLHTLSETFLLFDKIKARTHECLFSYLCMKHSELDFDWNFFEKIRTKRNRSMYYGEPVPYNDWKEIKLQIRLYINLLKKEILEKIS